jgi:hypothetical protein
MAKDLIIGGASGYNWDQLKYWINSIRKTGFAGDVVLVATNMTSETIKKLSEEGVKLALYGKVTDNGDVIAPDNNAPHVERFFYIWNFLNQNIDEYDNVIATDTRDVIFQSDPSVWLKDNLGKRKLVASSECMKYSDEPWNDNNLREAFGPFFHNHYRNMTIYNVGVVAGKAAYMRDLFFMIFQMSVNRPIPIVDQVVFNVLVQQKPFSDIFNFTNNSEAWAVQLGSSLEAVKSGAGDLGMSIAHNPSNIISYQAKYNDKQPVLSDDGYVVNVDGDRFCIVHQYDRTHAWTDKIVARFEE